MECQTSLEALKSKLLSAPILRYPNERDPYTLTIDASLTAIGAILTQHQQTEDRVIAYASKTLNKGQRNYKKGAVCNCPFYPTFQKLPSRSKIHYSNRPSSYGYIALKNPMAWWPGG